jgi:hypothetical protein
LKKKCELEAEDCAGGDEREGGYFKAVPARRVTPEPVFQVKKQSLLIASRVFEAESIKPSSREIRLESELQRSKDVIAEIASEKVELKRRFRTCRFRAITRGDLC